MIGDVRDTGSGERRAGGRPRRAPLEREREVHALEELVVAVASGDGAVALIEGPAGIGKTTLLASLGERASDTGFAVLRARGSELERDFAFGVVRQLLEPRFRGLAGADREAVLADAAGLAATVLGGGGGAVPVAADGVLHGLYWLVANLAEREPLVLLVDDAQWADEPSLQFLEYLARRREGVRVLVALAARTGEPGADPGQLRVLRAQAVLIRPAALSAAAVRSIACHVLGPGVSADVWDACHAASGGNPFLLSELLGALREQLDHGRDLRAADVPAIEVGNIAAPVAGRLAAIGGAAPEVARSLAVLGDGAELRHVAALAGVPAGAAGKAADALASANLLAPSRPLAFLHPLLRAAVYGQLGASERAAAHARAARLLSEAGADADAVAGHLMGSDPDGDPWTVASLRAAAGAALARGAPQIAVAFLGRALHEPPAADVRVDVLAELGTVEVLSGDPAGIVHLQEALAAAPAGRRFAEIARALAQGLLPLGRFEEAVALYDTAIGQLGDGDPEFALELEAEAASAGRLSRASFARTAERLRRFAGSVAGDTPAQRLLLANLAIQQMVDGTAREAAALAERALGGGALPDLPLSSASVYDALVPAIMADAFALARRHCDEGLADARRRGSMRDLVANLMFGSLLAYREGRVDDAESEGSAALEAALEGGFVFAVTAAAFLIDALIERGNLAAAADALARVGGQDEIPDSWMTNPLLHGRAQLRLAGGDLDGGIADLRALGAREDGFLGRNPSAYPYRSGLAIALAQRGEFDEALALAREELELARSWGARRAIGLALRALGLVERAERGIEHLREAVATLEPSGARLEHARALVDLGAALRRAGARVQARESLGAGMDLAHRCGATVLATRAREELVAAGARPRRLALSGAASLTPSERRVAQLVLERLTNKQIAQALFVTTRTVETHLANVYRKLDIASRDQLTPEILRGD